MELLKTRRDFFKASAIMGTGPAFSSCVPRRSQNSAPPSSPGGSSRIESAFHLSLTGRLNWSFSTGAPNKDCDMPKAQTGIASSL